MKPVFAAAVLVLLAACASEGDIIPHGSPWHTYRCDGGKTIQVRQMLQDDYFEIEAGGRTQLIHPPHDRGEEYRGGSARVSMAGGHIDVNGMPGGPYRGCMLADETTDTP